jgi:hypothetical protein
MRIGVGSTDTIADLHIDEGTLDLFQSLLLSVMAYAQGHACRINAHLAPAIRSIEP